MSDHETEKREASRPILSPLEERKTIFARAKTDFLNAHQGLQHALDELVKEYKADLQNKSVLLTAPIDRYIEPSFEPVPYDQDYTERTPEEDEVRQLEGASAMVTFISLRDRAETGVPEPYGYASVDHSGFAQQRIGFWLNDAEWIDLTPIEPLQPSV